MKVGIPILPLHKILSNRNIAIILLVILWVQIVPIEGYGVSALKVSIMALAPILFIIRVPYISKALLWGMLYWGMCFFTALFHSNMRFSTIGYLGMFVVSYITFYHLIHCGAFSLEAFSQLLRRLILVFAVVLVLQQLCLLIGIKTMPILNLDNQFFLSITKLPSLTLEPSHTARLLTTMMLCYLRCMELANGKKCVTVSYLFSPKERWVTIAFMWSMLTMGSGTAFIGLGLLSLYFIRWNTALYFIPAIITLFYLGQQLDLKQLDRAYKVVLATSTGDVNLIRAEDGSAATRIIPIINTFKMDLADKDIWFGKGTASKEYAQKGWLRTTDHTGCIDQYGLMAFIISLILIYTCAIKSFFSLETLMFVVLFGMALNNIAYVWGAIMLFSIVRYFQEGWETDIVTEDVD